MELSVFRRLPDEEVARVVSKGGDGLVCVFPYNGTRRWFELEYPDVAPRDYADTYMTATSQNLIALCQMFFNHGVDTLLVPLLSSEIADRGPEYMKTIGTGLARLVEQEVFRDFYERANVRVRVYGDYRNHLAGTPYAYLSDLFDQVGADTMDHDGPRLFYAIYAQDATDTLAEFTVQYGLSHGYPPSKDILIEHYYGEYVKPVDLFIGFGKPRVFDMPLIATGREGLYFTVSPSPYMTKAQLREILYDWRFTRRKAPLESYGSLAKNARDFVGAYYRANAGRTLGVGASEGAGFWYPVPQVRVLCEDGCAAAKSGPTQVSEEADDNP